MLHLSEFLHSTANRDDSGILPYIGGRLQAARAISRLLQEVLPPVLATRCRIVFVQSDRWVLCADSPVWATRLRLCIPALRRALPDRPEAIQSPEEIRVIVAMPEHSRTARRHRPPLRLSRGSAALIRKTAEGLADSDLARSLLRLAARSRAAADDHGGFHAKPPACQGIQKE